MNFHQTTKRKESQKSMNKIFFQTIFLKKKKVQNEFFILKSLLKVQNDKKTL